MGITLGVPIVTTMSRPLLASMFVYGGIDAVRHPDSKAPRAVTVTEPLTEATAINADATDLVRINGAVQIAAPGSRSQRDACRASARPSSPAHCS